MDNEFQSWRMSTPGSQLGRRRRFTAEQRAIGVSIARRALAAGLSRVEICRRMDVSDYTLRRWEKLRPALVPVEVVTEVVDEPVRLMMGRMHAELSVVQLAELARRLW